MNAPTRTRSPGALRGGTRLAVVLALCTGCTDGLPTGARSASAGAGSLDPGYFATGARIVETGPDGRARLRIEAERVDQLPGTRSIALTQPRFEVETERGRWRVRAAGGSLPEDASQIELRGDVRLASRVGSRDEPIEIRTELLSYESGSSRARAPGPVTITLSGKSLSASGLDADLKAQNVRLESQVHGRFTP